MAGLNDPKAFCWSATGLNGRRITVGADTADEARAKAVTLKVEEPVLRQLHEASWHLRTRGPAVIGAVLRATE